VIDPEETFELTIGNCPLPGVERTFSKFVGGPYLGLNGRTTLMPSGV